MVEGGDMVADLPYVIQRHARFLIQLEQQQVRQRRLGPLDQGKIKRISCRVEYVYIFTDSSAAKVAEKTA
jgi:hypothetical protein